jgi:hypothetical protein
VPSRWARGETRYPRTLDVETLSNESESSSRDVVGSAKIDDRLRTAPNDSSTHICATARGAFACYTKGGELVSLGLGFEARPYEVKDFFSKSGIATTTVPSGTFAKDGRVVFDHYRKRFFMVFQSREEHPRLLIAVSKTEDPGGGWWTYADNVETADVNGQDYMWWASTARSCLSRAICPNAQGHTVRQAGAARSSARGT